MPESLRSKSALIADNGLFVELAPRLAREFGEVRYWSPWASAYPKAAAMIIGEGLEGVERVGSFWDYVPDADIVIFPDLYMADMQAVVAERFGKPVWGHRQADRLELDRWGTRKLQKELGLAAPKTKFLVGVEELADYLQNVENKWVKISMTRGDMETFHHETWHITSIWLDSFANRVGALADSYEFIIEDAIDDAIEVGYDGFQVRGQWPEASYWGIEVKDMGYIGKFSPYADLPKPIRDINAKFSSILEREGSSGFLSFEFRLTKDGTAYMIDPCMRQGSPPTEGTMEGYDNLAEIMWEGAHGRLCPVRSSGEFLAMAMIHSQFALTNWVPVECPPDVRRWLKLRNAAEIDGKLYHVPVGGEMPEIGAVVAVADDLEEAKRLVKERAEKIKGFQLELMTDALDLAQKEIDDAKDYGIDF
jgi:hypothetical protein